MCGVPLAGEALRSRRSRAWLGDRGGFRICYRHTRLKLALCETHELDALVFPYHPGFAAPVRDPTFTADDPSYVPPGGVRSPSTLAGYSSVGFPSIVVPMGFGSQGIPMTIAFLGRPYDEGTLIGYAYDYEQATMLRRPSPLAPPLPGETIGY